MNELHVSRGLDTSPRRHIGDAGGTGADATWTALPPVVEGDGAALADGVTATVADGTAAGCDVGSGVRTATGGVLTERRRREPTPRSTQAASPDGTAEDVALAVVVGARRRRRGWRRRRTGVSASATGPARCRASSARGRPSCRGRRGTGSARRSARRCRSRTRSRARSRRRIFPLVRSAIRRAWPRRASGARLPAALAASSDDGFFDAGGAFDAGGDFDGTGSADTTVFASATGSGTLSFSITAVLGGGFRSPSLMRSERRTSFVSASGGSGGVGGVGICELGFSGCVTGGAEIGGFDEGSGTLITGITCVVTPFVPGSVAASAGRGRSPPTSRPCGRRRRLR